MSTESHGEDALLPKGYFYNPSGYLWLVLPVEKFEALPEELQINGKTLKRKTEFHVTVINGRGTAEKIAGDDSAAIPQIEIRLQELLREYINDHPLEFDIFMDDLRLAQLDGDESLAARCVLKNLEGYFVRLKEEFGIEVPVQPAHVSIYTHSEHAVGIDSVEQIESYEKVEIPEVQNILNKLELQGRTL